MTYLLSGANGNLTAAGTWKACDATSLLDSEVGFTALSTAYQNSATFTPGAITVDGVGLKLAQVAGATGTITVSLFDNTASADAAVVTTNISNLPLVSNGTTNEGGWYVLSFGSIALVAGHVYLVRAKSSAGASTVFFFMNGTTANWSRLLRTTTTQAPVTGDTIIVAGQDTGSAVTAYTVTMDNTDATMIPNGLAVCKGGTLAYGTSASTAYYLKLGTSTNLAGLIVYNGGTLQMGTSGTAMPASSIAVLEFVNASDGQAGLAARNGSTLTTYGQATTVGTYLTSDVAIAATTLNVVSTSGWVVGDQIVIASTSQTYSQAELRTILTIPNGTSVTVAALTYAHSGTIIRAGVGRAEVINISRNVKIRSSSSTAHSYVNIKATATAALTNTEVYYVGVNTAAQRGIEIESTTGACALTGCALHDTRNYGVYLTSASGSGIALSTCCFYNLSTTTTGAALTVTASSGVSSIDSCFFVLMLTAGSALSLLDAGITFTNNVVSSASAIAGSGSISVNEANATAGTFSGNSIHSNAGHGIAYPASGVVATVSTCQLWHNAYGFGCNSGSISLTASSCTVFGNVNANFYVGNPMNLLLARSCTFDGTATYTNGIGCQMAASATIFFQSCTFGTNVAHTQDISVSANVAAQVLLWNCTLGSGTQVASLTSTILSTEVVATKLGGVATSNKSWFKYGTLAASQITRFVASGSSWQLTPNTAGQKLIFPGPTTLDTFKVVVNANALATVTAWVVKSDLYTGSSPRLVLVGGMIAGIAADVVATHSEPTRTITSATNATPISVTATAHGYSTGDTVLIGGVVGNTAANANWVVTVVDVNTFTLNTSVGNGAYSSGGKANRWQQLSVSGTPTEVGAAEVYLDCDGAAGSVYVDATGVVQ